MPVDFLKETHKLAQPIYDQNFVEQLIDSSGLTKKRIQSLKQLGYYSVYINDSNESSDFQSVPAQLLKELYLEVSNVFSLIKGMAHLDSNYHVAKLPVSQIKILDDYLEKLNNKGEELILYLLKDRSPNLHIYETKSLKLYSVQHAVHTSLYAIKLGLQRNLNMKTLKNLFMGSVLYDIGYFLIDDFDPVKMGLLNDAQRELQAKHVQFCYELLGQCNTISSATKTICLQHHEKEDASGYPNKLNNQSINPLTKVLIPSIAFDALTSDRPFRPAYPIHKALSIINAQIGSAYDSLIVEFLNGILQPFPIGTVVKVNQSIGRIVNYDDSKKTPIIVMQDGQSMNLTNYESMTIGLHYRDL